MNNDFIEDAIDLNFLRSDFSHWDFSCFKASVGLYSPQSITAFCCQAPSLSNLQHEWRDINSLISVEYLCLCEDIFARWNTYLLFVCAENIPKNIQYEIENNKFSMRKIVAKDKIQSNFLNSDQLKNIINERIQSSNVQLIQMESIPVLELELSSITTRFLDANIIPDNSQLSRDNREKWLNQELERISVNEN